MTAPVPRVDEIQKAAGLESFLSGSTLDELARTIRLQLKGKLPIPGRRASLRHPVDRLAFLQRLHDADVLDRHRLNGERVFVEDDAVRELTGLDRALGPLLAVLPCQRTDALVRADDLAAS